MTSKGSISNYQIQTIEGNTIYPQDFFNSYDDATGQLNITDNTRSIHWFDKTWLPKESQWRVSLKRFIRRCLGKSILQKLK